VDRSDGSAICGPHARHCGNWPQPMAELIWPRSIPDATGRAARARVAEPARSRSSRALRVHARRPSARPGFPLGRGCRPRLRDGAGPTGRVRLRTAARRSARRLAPPEERSHRRLHRAPGPTSGFANTVSGADRFSAVARRSSARTAACRRPRGVGRGLRAAQPEPPAGDRPEAGDTRSWAETPSVRTGHARPLSPRATACHSRPPAAGGTGPQ